MPLPAWLLKEIRDEIRGGVRNDAARLDDAEKNLHCYNGNWKMLPVKAAAGDWDKIRPRYSMLMQRIVNVLTGTLYRDGPKRMLPEHVEASKWLEWVYRCNAVDAIWQQADRYATVSDCAAIQVVKTADPMRPLRLYLWDASQFSVWLDPEDQTQPVAVAVVDKFNERKRLRLWTDATITTYMTEQRKPGQTSGATALNFVDEKPHSYGQLPFTFAHFNMPLCDFWSHGPGSHLRGVNEGVNANLTQTGGSITYNLVPIVVGKNIRAGWKPGNPVKPGDFWMLPPDPDAEGQNADPSAEYLQADSSFVAASWEDLAQYLDHTMEMTGVPASAVRMVQDSVRSGVSIIMEQIPLVTWARSRQRPFSYYEDALAKLVLSIGAQHLGSQDVDEYRVTASQLTAAADEPGMVLRWPKMYPDVPGVEQDTSDGWLLDNGMASRTTLLMRREGWTREEAREYLEDVAEDVKFEHELFGEAEQVKAQQEADKAKLLAQATAEPDGDEDPKPQTKTEPNDE